MIKVLRLLQNEIIKLLKKKSFYVVTIIFILFCVLTNIVYKSDVSTSSTEVDPSTLEKENQRLDLTNSEDLLIYVDNLTTLKVEELKETYNSNTQAYLIANFLYQTIYNMYEAKYILNDQDLYQAYISELDELIKHLDDWHYFLDERLTYLEAKISSTKNSEQERYQKLLAYANYRKENDIAYDPTNYLHQALVFLEENTAEYLNLQNLPNLTKEEEERLAFLEEQMAIYEYILDTKEDILNNTTLRAVLTNFSAEFGLFILIYVIMISASIVSDEYARGTIKYLLTKPFKRRTILTSKLLTILILIPIIMVFMSLIEIIIGGIILGFDSLKIPIVLYQEGVLYTYSPLKYLASSLLSSFPIYLVIAILGLLLSTLTLSTSAAITISFLFYLLGNVISNLALIYDWLIFKGFISLYWDFSYLVYGNPQPYGSSVLFSVFIICIYIFLMLCLTYVIFIKKDVKNT